jgi:hypothetical protein
LIDDIDRGAATETIGFSLDGKRYEIDLSARNAAILRRILGPYAEAGRRLTTRDAAAVAPIARCPPRSTLRRFAHGRCTYVPARDP